MERRFALVGLFAGDVVEIDAVVVPEHLPGPPSDASHPLPGAHHDRHRTRYAGRVVAQVCAVRPGLPSR